MDSLSSDSGISSAISEEEVDTVDLLHEKRKLIGSLSSKAKATFEEIKRIIYQVSVIIVPLKEFALDWVANMRLSVIILHKSISLAKS